MARRRSLTTRGVLALALAPCSALAGVLLGAEELVLLAIALGTLLVCGLVQCASRAGRATGRWRVAVDLAASEAEVSTALQEQRIDGAVLGWNVPGLAGLDLLTILRDATGRGELRVLIYPETPLSQADKDGIAAWDDAAVIQIASSPEDLLDKSMTMFHRKETELPRDKRDKLAAARAVDRRLAGRKILIVDDDLRNIFALTSALEVHDMNLTLAENGQKGIEALHANPDVELVLMDIMLPEMDGYQAMRAIRKMPQYRELPVIALTAQAMKGDRERCIEAGATDYIAKPVEIDQLLALMRVWLPEAQKA